MSGYTSRDVAKLLNLSVGQVRSYARAGFLEPQRGPRGEYRFSFQDLVVLRTATGLIAQRVPPKKVKSTLKSLKERLPRGRPLTALQIDAEGERIVVRDGATTFNPESGQAQLDFDIPELADKVAKLAERIPDELLEDDEDLTADDWHELGCELEASAPEPARDAYRRALELDPQHLEARLNLGRLLHEAALLDAAEGHYRITLMIDPKNAIAAFNLGVSLEDAGRYSEAGEYYRRAIQNDPKLPDAHYNLARLLEHAGDQAGALEEMAIYRRLLES